MTLRHVSTSSGSPHRTISRWVASSGRPPRPHPCRSGTRLRRPARRAHGRGAARPGEEYLAFTEPRLPWLVEELEGIAETAGIDPLDLFAASIEELWYEPRRKVTQGRCSDVVAGPRDRRGPPAPRPHERPTPRRRGAHRRDREAGRGRPDDLPARRRAVAPSAGTRPGSHHRQRALAQRRAARHLTLPSGARDDAGLHPRRDGVDVAATRPRVELQQRAHERRRRHRQRRGERHRRRGHGPR